MIHSVGNQVEIPANSVIYDLGGAWIMPSFIDLDSDYGLKKKKEQKSPGRRNPQYESKKKGAYNWNEAIHPEINASQVFHVNDNKAKSLRNMGFGAVMTHSHDGIMRGNSVLVSTGNEKDNLVILKEKSAQHISFYKGSSKQAYPSSEMGSIALIRQTFYDAQWYSSDAEKKEFNLSLQAIEDNKDLPVFFESTNYMSSLRAAKISDEFDIPFTICGSGDEYKRAEKIKETGMNFVIPIKFPLPYDVSNSYDAVDLSLSRMKHWELAPYNARILHDHEINFAISGKELKGKEFQKNLKRIEQTGLNSSDILAALTTIPAEMVGMEKELGKIEIGYKANFLICSEAFLKGDMLIYENWVNGKRYVINEKKIDIRGEYNLNVNKNGGMRLVVEGSREKPKASLFKGSKEMKVSVELKRNQISLNYRNQENQTVLLSGIVNDENSRIWSGKAQLSNGDWVDWAAIKQPEKEKKDTSESADSAEVLLPVVTYPLTSYGFDSLPSEALVILKHATVWTNEEDGILENTDVAIADGKILKVGQSLSKIGLFGTKEVEVEIINAKGKHITAGIIDEHSHIALSRGVNESGQSSSAEVRIGDVINSDDINIYRQLAGGVTASQLLHGSANPIGGQSGLVKMRWGSSPEEMKIEGADGFIKFALGENVKQSNWGDQMKIRYPQTRMGVEQVYYDAFYRAREYGEMKKIYESGLKSSRKKNPPIAPRKDLELEALLEILDSTRFITCHSYIQSEINMLMHVGDSMGFRVNTFTHILEGYKVADKMKEHGVGGSTFSDWWAYKYEVNDAIPYNAALMSEVGIVTAINSDDAEMGRRLNQEAAKGVKYGGMSQEEAWKMVTLNPAKLLHLDDRMGSIAEGKDADIVLWSNNPLSINAKAERTYVDGRLLFDVERDKEMRQYIKEERARLITKMIEEKSKSGKSQKVKKENKLLYHCDTEIEEYDEDL